MSPSRGPGPAGALPNDAAAVGWHGKLPSLGDFASRRLDGGFLDAWDGWLAQGLAALRGCDGWLDAYLASPSWCFLLMPEALPGAAGLHAWTGVLMPSVDRAGRYYPFTLAHPLAAAPADGAAARALWAWLRQADDTAAQALQDDWDLPTLEDALLRLGLPPGPRDAEAPTAVATKYPQVPVATQHAPMHVATQRPPVPVATQHAPVHVAPQHPPVPVAPQDAPVHVAPQHPPVLLAPPDPPAVACAQAAALWHEHMRGRALWWGAASDAPPRLLVSAGLEGPGLVGRLFGEGAATVPAAPDPESAR